MSVKLQLSHLPPADTERNPEHWFLVQLKPGGLKRACVNLHRQGFFCFMPVRETSVRRRGRIEASYTPLFPGYVFTRVLPNQQHWRAINSTYGVSRLVSLVDGVPTPIPEALMTALFDCTDDAGLMKAPDDLKENDTVRILSGPFAKVLATIESVKPNNRVILLMDVMGRAVRTDAETKYLERA